MTGWLLMSQSLFTVTGWYGQSVCLYGMFCFKLIKLGRGNINIGYLMENFGHALKNKKKSIITVTGRVASTDPSGFPCAGCHRPWCLNDFEHIIKRYHRKSSLEARKPVDTNTVHTLYQGMRFICLHDDPRIKVIVIFNHAHFPMRFPLSQAIASVATF